MTTSSRRETLTSAMSEDHDITDMQGKSVFCFSHVLSLTLLLQYIHAVSEYYPTFQKLTKSVESGGNLSSPPCMSGVKTRYRLLFQPLF